MELITLSSRGQLVIPERIRDRYGLAAGSRLALFETANGIVLRKQEDVEALVEKAGWLTLSERGLKRVWKTPEEDEAWKGL